MTPRMRHLILTTARIMRANLDDWAKNEGPDGPFHADLADMNEALAPFDSKEQDGGLNRG